MQDDMRSAKVEPVAWLYECYDGRTVLASYQLDELRDDEAWYETPLIPAPKGQSDE